MKKVLQRLFKIVLGSQYHASLRRVRFLVRKYKGGYFSINQLDRQLEEYVNYNDGFFVELGANDGVMQSNSLYFKMYINFGGL